MNQKLKKEFDLCRTIQSNHNLFYHPRYSQEVMSDPTILPGKFLSKKRKEIKIMKTKIEKIGTKEMVQEISQRMGCYHRDVREVLDHFTNIMVENLKEGRKVQFMPLGVFSPKEIRHRDKNNVNDIKDIKIKFKQSLTITRKLANGSTGAEHAEIEETEDQQVS